MIEEERCVYTVTANLIANPFLQCSGAWVVLVGRYSSVKGLLASFKDEELVNSVGLLLRAVQIINSCRLYRQHKENLKGIKGVDLSTVLELISLKCKLLVMLKYNSIIILGCIQQNIGKINSQDV
jgi:hypothetical protein